MATGGGTPPCALQCPDGQLDPILCRCIYPTREPTATPAVVTKYYFLGSQRIAMRAGGVLYYLHADHPSLCSGQAWVPPS